MWIRMRQSFGGLSYFLPYMITGMAYFAVLKRGYFSLTPFLFLVFVLAPLDELCGNNFRNVNPPKDPGHEGWIHTALFLTVPLQAFLTLWAVYLAGTQPLSIHEFIALAFSVGISNFSVGMVAAHELVHKNGRFSKFLGQIMLLMVNYMPFIIEHLKVHHVHYGTPKDPTTALLGESFYHYLPKTLGGKYVRESWQAEFSRLRTHGYARWGWHNQMLWFFVLPVLLATGIGLLWGTSAVLFFFAQTAVAVITFEIITYVQHYGLQRKEIAPGRFEAGAAVHSWDSYRWLTNLLVLQYARHFDHHTHVTREYYRLNCFPTKPRILPYGYVTMILLALVPPWWKKIMDPLATKGTSSD